MRLVIPSWFVLQVAGLDQAHAEGRTTKLIEYLRSRLAAGPAGGRANVAGTHATTNVTTHVPPEPGIPVALRWVTLPDLGFPRAPFLVWRRRRDYKAGVSLTSGPVAVSGTTTVSWTVGEMIEVLLRGSPSAGTTLVVEALDAKSEPIPGQRLVFTASTLGVFRSPGIAALRVSGSGSVTSVAGVDQTTLANAAGWELLQRVGLPFDKSEIAAPAYTSAPQGFEPAALEGLAAAQLRLEMAQILQLDPPATGVAGVATPAWPAPDPKLYLRVLRDTSPGPLPLIDKCLNDTDDSDPSRLQGDYRVDLTVDGIRQSAIPGATPGDPANASVPVVGVTMLSVGHDSDAATGLGYGTVDIPPQRGMGNPYGNAILPPGTVIPSFDHMVTADFTIPFFGSLELAALGQTLAAPTPPAGLQVAASAGNRPAAQDVAATEVVSVSWLLPLFQEAYGVAVSRAGAAAAVVNAGRGFSAGGYDPWVPLRPPNVNGSPPPGARATFTDGVAPAPLSGSLASRYLVVGRDVAGRWSSWASAVHTATAPAVEAPGLLSAACELGTLPATGRLAPGTMIIEFSWDWADRTPEKIELFGTFFAPTATPSGTFSGGFAKAASAAIGGAVSITFDAAGDPVLGAGFTGSVVQLPSTAGAGTTPGETRRYRVRIEGLTADFATADQVAYAVTARGYEHVRPTEPSAVVGPRIARIDNPFPAATPTLPIDLIWTALPDAAGRARAVLTWPAAAGASGYVVWEATETALRTAVAPTASPPAPGTSILARAGALRALVTQDAASQARSLKAFSRMHDRPLTATSLELELPGAADTLYAYRVSSLTAANVESPRSPTVALVAVPRRSRPGAPRLLLRRSSSPVGIDVIVVPGAGVAPSGYRVHRVRNATLATEVGLMGPAKYDPGSAGWTAVTVPGTGGASDAGLAIFDPVAPSWSAYHYRAVAIGPSDLTNGLYAGESPASGVASAVLPPAGPPVVDSIARVGGNGDNQVVTFRTDLPVRESPLGLATITVTALGTGGGAVSRETLLTVEPRLVQEAPALTVLPAGSPVNTATITRGAPDGAGRAVYTVRLPGTFASGATGGTIGVTDPSGRVVEAAWP